VPAIAHNIPAISIFHHKKKAIAAGSLNPALIVVAIEYTPGLRFARSTARPVSYSVYATNTTSPAPSKPRYEPNSRSGPKKYAPAPISRPQTIAPYLRKPITPKKAAVCPRSSQPA